VASGFMDDFKRFFLRGLAAVLPTVVTIALIIWVVAQIDQYAGRQINVAVQWLTVQVLTVVGGMSMSWDGPAELRQRVQQVWAEYHLGWIGFVLAICAIYVFGRFVASYIGRVIWRLIEQAFFRAPIIKQVYPHVKQVTDFLLSERKIEFSRVVMVEYPRKGVWSLGLVTGPGMRLLHGSLGSDLLTIFVPSSPTPFTGYTITVRRDEVVDMPLSIDDALRFTVSGGVIMPISQQMSEAEIEQARKGAFPPRLRKETAK